MSEQNNFEYKIRSITRRTTKLCYWLIAYWFCFLIPYMTMFVVIKVLWLKDLVDYDMMWLGAQLLWMINLSFYAILIYIILLYTPLFNKRFGMVV